MNFCVGKNGHPMDYLFHRHDPTIVTREVDEDTGLTSIVVEEKSAPANNAPDTPPPTTLLYLISVWGDVEPHLNGPFESDEKRLERAREIRKNDENDEGGLYRLDIEVEGTIKKVEVDAFSGNEIGAEDEEEKE